jgi:hypothetical protein
MNATAEMQWRSPFTDAFGPDYAAIGGLNGSVCLFPGNSVASPTFASALPRVPYPPVLIADSRMCTVNRTTEPVLWQDPK